MGKMHDFEAYYVDYEDLLHDNRFQAARKRKALNKMTDSQFLDVILCYPSLNNIVGRNFPAYDIAKRIKENNWTLSEKQRKAMTNVYLFYLYETY